MAFPVNTLISTDKLLTIRSKINEIISTFENVSFSGTDLIYDGDLQQTGERVLVNQAEESNGSIDLLPGIEIERGTATNQVLVWDDSDDTWKVGTVSSLTPISLEGHLHDLDYYRRDEDITLESSKIVNNAGENGIIINSGNTTIEGDLTLNNSTTPTEIEFYNTYTDETTYEKGMVKFESDILKIGVEQQNGTLPEMGFVQTGIMKFFTYQATLNDDASFTLPIINNSAWGFVTVGSGVEYSMYTIAANGTVILISNSANVITGSDIEDKFIIGTGVASPVVIKNTLGSNLNVNLMMFYN
jgi:hypothetical protein